MFCQKYKNNNKVTALGISSKHNFNDPLEKPSCYMPDPSLNNSMLIRKWSRSALKTIRKFSHVTAQSSLFRYALTMKDRISTLLTCSGVHNSFTLYGENNSKYCIKLHFKLEVDEMCWSKFIKMYTVFICQKWKGELK